jgi:hypothetical protein
MVTGEWTPSYSSLPWVAPLLRLAAPDARLLFMVRDPVVRLQLALGDGAERRGAQPGTAISDAVHRGFYAEQLRRILDVFPRDQVLVLQYEQCALDPVAHLAATYRFLGLDDAHRPRRLQSGVPSGVGGLPAVDPETRKRLAGLYADDIADLTTEVPDLDLSLWSDQQVD